MNTIIKEIEIHKRSNLFKVDNLIIDLQQDLSEIDASIIEQLDGKLNNTASFRENIIAIYGVEVGIYTDMSLILLSIDKSELQGKTYLKQLKDNKIIPIDLYNIYLTDKMTKDKDESHFIDYNNISISIKSYIDDGFVNFWIKLKNEEQTSE